MNWLKSTGNWIVAAVVAFLALMAARQVGAHKRRAEKWQERATAEAESGRDDAIKRSKAALSQAKLAEARAAEAKRKARDRLDNLGTRNEEVADIVDRWRKSGGVRD